MIPHWLFLLLLVIALIPSLLLGYGAGWLLYQRVVSLNPPAYARTVGCDWCQRVSRCVFVVNTMSLGLGGFLCFTAGLSTVPSNEKWFIIGKWLLFAFVALLPFGFAIRVFARGENPNYRPSKI